MIEAVFFMVGAFFFGYAAGRKNERVDLLFEVNELCETNPRFRALGLKIKFEETK